MINRRYNIYKEFNQYKKEKDFRSMDEICGVSGEFSLQAQQTFLKSYVTKHPQWKTLVFYHGIGAGKTCTSIVIAQQYLNSNPGCKVNIILPARLRTNFLDELISPCGMEKYISKTDFIVYSDSETPKSRKSEIKKDFMKKIESDFHIISFQEFANSAKKADNLKIWCHHMTHNRMIIIDEVHNLLNTTYSPESWEDMLKNHILQPKTKGVSTLLFKYLTMHASETSKILMMTATPVFDNMSQFKELVSCVNPQVSGNISNKTMLSEAIEYLRGKVSFFPGTSVNAYPKVKYEEHFIPFSKTQDTETNKIIQAKNRIEAGSEKESFLLRQRQASLVCLPGRMSPSAKANLKQVLSNLKEYAPKIRKLLENLEKPGKHVVFSNFVESGLYIVKSVLDNNGWTDFSDIQPDITYNTNKVYAIWDGATKDESKQNIKSVVNSKDNIKGNIIRVILGSPSIKEGVSFKHIQHLHMLDPVWNQSARTQVEGRAIRFCSHVDIDEKTHAPLKREVVVHLYESIPSEDGVVKLSCDQHIYQKVIPEKYKQVKIAEDALKRVAIDYYLFRKMYRETPVSSPKSVSSFNSTISISEDIPLNKKGVKAKAEERGVAVKSSCPKHRRPDAEGNCGEGRYKKNNKKGDECCYKLKKTK